MSSQRYGGRRSSPECWNRSSRKYSVACVRVCVCVRARACMCVCEHLCVHACVRLSAIIVWSSHFPHLDTGRLKEHIQTHTLTQVHVHTFFKPPHVQLWKNVTACTTCMPSQTQHACHHKHSMHAITNTACMPSPTQHACHHKHSMHAITNTACMRTRHVEVIEQRPGLLAVVAVVGIEHVERRVVPLRAHVPQEVLEPQFDLPRMYASMHRMFICS
jgi:hypothetical protein